MVRFEIVDEAAEPGGASLRVRPDFNVLIHALEYRPAEFESRIDFVNCGRELEVERAIVLGQHVLAVRLLAHLDVGDRIAALLDVCDLGGGIVGRAVEHGNGNHRR